MKKATLSVFLLINLSAVAQQWEWAKIVNLNLPVTMDASQIRVAPDNNGNFYLSYFHWDSNYGYPDGSVIGKYDAGGNEVWKKEFTSRIRVYDIAADNAGAVYMTGDFMDTVNIDGTVLVSNGYNDEFFVKFDSNGNLQWTKTSGGLYNDAGYGLCTDARGNIFLTGEHSDSAFFYGNWISQNISNFTVSKYDASGNIIFYREIDERNGAQEWYRGDRIQLDRSGNILVLGVYSSGEYGANFFCKLDTVGTMKWWQSVTSFTDKYHDFYLDDDNSILATGDGGWTSGSWTNTDRLDPAGNRMWHMGCGLNCGPYSDGNLNSLAKHSTNFITVGHSECHGMLLIKYSSTGSVVYFDTIPAIDYVTGKCLRKNSEGKYITAGFIRGRIKIGNDSLHCTSPKIFIAKFSDDAATTSVVKQTADCEIHIFPNPTSGLCTLELPLCSAETDVVVRNMLGECLFQKRCAPRSSQNIDLSTKPKGVYFVELIADGKRETKKIVLH